MPDSARTILIVDDREQNRYIASRILRDAGYLVDEGCNGREALEKVLREPALVILDVRLPDILGYEVCRRIKDNPKTTNIPVLLVSAAFTSSESRVQALDVGAEAYLLQPLEPTVLIATVRALLRLRQAESESRLAARQWQGTFDALAEGIALLDSEWRVLRCNRGMTKLLGKTYGEIERREIRTLLREELKVPLTATELPYYSGDVKRERQWFSIRMEAVKDGDRAAGAIVIITDITERRLAEEALRATEKAAAMGRLANSIAHEINNPLEAVTNLLYLLKSGTHDRETTELIEMASVELDRVSRITKQTLAFHRESSHAIEVSLPELIDGVVTLYSPQFNQKSIRIVRRYEGHPAVPGFPGELRQVFSNLLRNAMEAIPQGGQITVRVRQSGDWKDPSRGGARVTILDSGTGMSGETKRNIFEPFFTTKELKGSGLGLWLSMGIISRHKGSITVRSSTKTGCTGTCFSLFLPGKGTVAANAA
ncbi:MAG: response regulator [Acidobacteria bacterium]|nr:response regulator [Acidobacteriota bacterium]